MNAVERYRALIEAREGPAGPADPGEHYLRSARLHVPGGALVYSRGAIVDFLAEFNARPGADRASPPAAPEPPEVISAPAAGATLLAARYRPPSAATTRLSLAVMRGDWINEEWLFGAESARRVPEEVDPKRMEPFIHCPAAMAEKPAESMPGSAWAHGAAAAALDGFHRSCNLGRRDALDAVYAPNAALDLADGETGRGIPSAAGFHAGVWRRFCDPSLYAERVVAPADDPRAAVLWHLTGGAPDAPRRLHLHGLSIWRFDAAGRIVAEWTRFDTAAMQRRRADDAAAWRAWT